MFASLVLYPCLFVYCLFSPFLERGVFVFHRVNQCDRSNDVCTSVAGDPAALQTELVYWGGGGCACVCGTVKEWKQRAGRLKEEGR
jgi:hypothetical protein